MRMRKPLKQFVDTDLRYALIAQMRAQITNGIYTRTRLFSMCRDFWINIQNRLENEQATFNASIGEATERPIGDNDFSGS